MIRSVEGDQFIFIGGVGTVTDGAMTLVIAAIVEIKMRNNSLP